MISKNKVKFLRCLTNKKYRLKNKKVFLEGRRLVDEALNSLVNFETIWLTKSAFENSMNAELINKIRTKKILLDEISNIDLHDLSDTENSQGIIAEIDINKFITSSLDDITNDNLLILDGISDPGNLGTIFRTAAWYNIQSIILTSDCVDPFNLKCLRSGVGAHFYFQNIVNAKREDVIKFLGNNNYDIYCADLNGIILSDVKLKNKWAVILGSEAHGLNPDFNIYNKVTIKKHGNIESLNASVACGIILDKFVSI
tara:strand:+ start:1704 stop:2471 length:768 start_codon:yes stop_codon:yes gene_type:complete